MLVLVINCGSSSVKYSLFSSDNGGELLRLARGLVSELGKDDASIRYETETAVYTLPISKPNYRQALQAAIGTLTHPQYGKLQDASEIGAVGHRTVHGGDKFTGSVLIDNEVIAKMEQCSYLAPIHNPANLEGIRQAISLFPNTSQIAVFDTSFHQSIPVHARVYPLPYEFYVRLGIRKYGFHGTSCQYASQQACRLVNRELALTRIVVCHLGNGVSVTAVNCGRSVDTSLGYTSVGGVMMGTRCGDLDPGVLLAIMKDQNLSVEEADKILHHQSGLLGISGVSNDMQIISQSAWQGDARCQLAIEMFSYQIKKYIGAYAAVMGGIDILVFTGGIGENSSIVRKLAVENLAFLGIEMDHDLNNAKSTQDRMISPPGARAAVAVINANEEKMIAQEVIAVLEDIYRS